jgi:hypothetical protein
MAKVEVSQRGNNRSTSTLDIQHNRVFIGDNAYTDATFANNTGGELILQPYSLVVRNVANGQIIPATAANLADVIGIVATLEDITLADAATLSIPYCHKGKIDETKLELPDTITLGTTVGSRFLRDVLNSLGFDLEATIENFKYDN